VVYIAEAHALDGVSPNLRKGAPLVEEPETMKERIEVAGKCVVALEIKQIPALIDSIDDATSKAYVAHPDRLYLVGKDGKIAYAGGKGPRGFSTKELDSAIQKELEIKEGEEEE